MKVCSIFSQVLKLFSRGDFEKAVKALVGAGSTVAVREHRDGALSLLCAGIVLRWHELTQRPKAKEPVAKRRIVTRLKPAPKHPWRKPFLAARAS